MIEPVCEDCGDVLQPKYEDVHEIDYGTGFQCGACRETDLVQDRLDSIHPADALDYMLTGRWR